jgi:mono/diheme cytochrome c family protein
MRGGLGAVAVMVMAAVAGCGGKDSGGSAAPPPAAIQSAGDLTPFQLEHGIGPVTEVVTLGALDKSLADSGQKVFAAKCTACHKLGEKYIGPALGEVLTRRTPTYVMNMILNPNEMVERHPVAKQLLAEAMTLMANQGLTVGEARAVVEYFRTQATRTVKTQ